MKFKVGDKVVPINKTAGGTSLDECDTWKNAKKMNQPYLYVTKVYVSKLACDEKIDGSGDHFRESDLIPYVESFVLPEKWCIKGCKELSNYCRENINGKFRTNVGGCCTDYCYYKTDIKVDLTLEDWIWTTTPITDGYTIISLEQFQQYVLKINTMKEKEIIGWKLKEDCKQYEKVAFELAGKNGSKDSWDLIDGYHFTVNSTNAQKLKAAGVLDLWFEPVYKEDYQNGDWVVLSSNTGYSISRCKSNIAKLVKYKQPLTKDDHSLTGSYSSYCLFSDGGLYSADRNTAYILRKATQQEIQNHLVNLAKEKGFVDGVISKDIFANEDATILSSAWGYFEASDSLYNNGNLIYQKGKWATIKPQKEVVSVGGKFDVEIRDGKIWHKSDDITTFVDQLVNCNKATSAQYGGYMAGFKDIIFEYTGCQKVETKLSDWKKVLDIYNKINKS